MANFNIDYLVVAGGGAGQGVRGGGGGAGGLLTTTSYGGSGTALSLVFGTEYTATIGTGGYGAQDSGSYGQDGSDSYFDSISANGGGGGGRSTLTGRPGGSGGGGGNGGTSYSNQGGAATPAGQGSPGGRSPSFTDAGGGGGATGPNPAGFFNLGATGLSSNITGTSVTYATGGRGGYGGQGSSTGISGAANTGNGGSGMFDGYQYSGRTAGSGGSGVVILRYATADVYSYTTTGITPIEDTTTIPGQTILSFTTVGTGTITFTTTPPPTPFDGTKVTNPVTGFNKTGTSEGLKLPSGDNSNQPAGALAEQGMIRNDTEETVDSSASAIAHYNGTNWQYFAATESVDNPKEYSTFAAWDVGNSISYSGTGNILYNIINNPNGFNFTKYGGVSYDSTNKSFSFNGATGSNGAYMRFSQNAMNIPTGFTVSMWVNFTSFTGDDALYAYGYSPSLRQFANSSQMRYYITPGPSGAYTPYFNHGMTTGNWYNITMVINNSNAISPTTIKTYISQEGDSIATLKQTVNTNHGAYQNTNQLYFGCNVQNYNSNFNGQLRVMEIYDSQLSQTDIDSIVNQGSQQ